MGFPRESALILFPCTVMVQILCFIILYDGFQLNPVFIMQELLNERKLGYPELCTAIGV